MKTTIVELGHASQLTRDYTGDFQWDNLFYDFKKKRTID